MTFSSTLVLAFGMSMDAFAASLCKGAALTRPPLREALRTGLIFGLIEALTPLIGWLLGRTASQYVSQWDHWIAFALLGALGTHMIINGFRHTQTEDQPAPRTRHRFRVLALTALATSLDALTVGVSLALLATNILPVAAAIGGMTLLMTTIGMLAGRSVGPLFGKRAEIVGGLVLILIGGQILHAHLTAPL